MEENLRIIVEKSKILERIYLESSYFAGKRTDDLVNYDRISAIGEDAEYLGLLIDEVAVEMAAWLDERLDSLEIDDGMLNYVAAGECDMDLAGAAIGDYIASEVLCRWLLMAGEEVSALKAETEAKRSLLKSLIHVQVSRGVVADNPKIASPRWYPAW